MWPVSDLTSLPVSASQILRALSSPPEATVLPSGLKATHQTRSAWPVQRTRARPVSASQTTTAPSALAAATRRPSGLKATAWTTAAWRSRPSPKRRATWSGRPAGRPGKSQRPCGRRRRPRRTGRPPRFVAALGVGTGLLIPIGREFLGQALLVSVGPLRAELRLEVAGGCVRRSSARDRPTYPLRGRPGAERASRRKAPSWYSLSRPRTEVGSLEVRWSIGGGPRTPQAVSGGGSISPRRTRRTRRRQEQAPKDCTFLDYGLFPLRSLRSPR